MDDSGILGSALGQVGNIVKATGQQIVKDSEEMAKDVKSQIVGKKQEESRWQSDEERIKFLKDLYGSAKQNSSEQVKKDDSQTQHNKKLTEFEKKIADKSPEEQKTLLELRQDLHKEVYYDPTFNPPKKQEERPAEKVENEKKQEMQDLQKKEEKKPPPLAVQRAAQKIENIPGAG